METQPVLEFKSDSKGLWNIRKGYLGWTTAAFIMMAILSLFDPRTVKINGRTSSESVAIWVNLASIVLVFVICTIIQQLIIHSNYKGLTIRINDEMIGLTVPWRVTKLLYLVRLHT